MAFDKVWLYHLFHNLYVEPEEIIACILVHSSHTITLKKISYYSQVTDLQILRNIQILVVEQFLYAGDDGAKRAILRVQLVLI
jgi:hypothetical protein